MSPPRRARPDAAGTVAIASTTLARCTVRPMIARLRLVLLNSEAHELTNVRDVEVGADITSGRRRPVLRPPGRGVTATWAGSFRMTALPRHAPRNWRRE